MEMVRRMLTFAGMLAALNCAAAAADFSLTIGSPVAAAGSSTNPGYKKVSKTALFAVRMEGCAAIETARLTGTAEGIVNGVRTSSPVGITEMSPGVYVVSPYINSPAGPWMASLSANCGNATAGALVPIGPQGFIRDQTKLLPRAATKAEIEAALKALPAPAQ